MYPAVKANSFTLVDSVSHPGTQIRPQKRLCEISASAQFDIKGAESRPTSRCWRKDGSGLLSPGARYAFNFPNDAQLIVALAVPIGLTSDSPDYGLFFCCSFEHPFVRTEPSRTR